MEVQAFVLGIIFTICVYLLVLRITYLNDRGE